MRHILTLLCLILSASTFAQRLAYENLSQPNAIFAAEGGEWAGVIIQTKADNKPLSFESNIDKIEEMEKKPKIADIPKRVSAVIYKVIEDAGNITYEMMFRTDKKYYDRTLIVSSYARGQVYMELTGLTKNISYYYRIYDPNDADDGTCYQEHIIKGNQYFDKFKYAAAKEEFLLATQCSEIQETDREIAETKIETCDSIMLWIAQGNQWIKEKKYDLASNVFSKAHQANLFDDYLANRRRYCERNRLSVCALYLTEADDHFSNKDYETAKDLYQAVIDNGCDNTSQLTAQSRMKECETQIRRHSNLERYFGLEFGENFGFTVGSLLDHVGMFGTFRTNNNTLELARKVYNLDEIAKFDATLGVTIPLLNKRMNQRLKNYIFKGVWLNIGAGITAANKFQVAEELLTDSRWGSYFDYTPLKQEHIEAFLKDDDVVNSKAYTDASDVLTPKYGITVNGEIGLTIKVWRVAVRGTYFFRKPVGLTKDYIDEIGKSGCYIGIGWCW